MTFTMMDHFCEAQFQQAWCYLEAYLCLDIGPNLGVVCSSDNFVSM